MKSLTILAVAAAFTCVACVENEHHGSFDHMDHDLIKNGHVNHDKLGHIDHDGVGGIIHDVTDGRGGIIHDVTDGRGGIIGHVDHDKLGHIDHDGIGGIIHDIKDGRGGLIGHVDHDKFGHIDHDGVGGIIHDGKDREDGSETTDEHGRDPLVSPPEEPNYEIQTKPPVVVLTTVTLTKPWAIAKSTPTPNPPAYPAAQDPPASEPEEDQTEADRPNGFHHDNSDHERTHATHDREHDKYHDRDHSKSHGPARIRQKGRIEGVRVNAVASKPAAAVEPAAESDKPLAAAAVSASPAASKPSKMSSAAAAAVTQSSTASTRVNVVNSAADHLRIGGSLVAAAAGVAAWLLL